jgi:hypothetical protein|tara:strand:+ start:3838 stop:4053 length:216 start_codon:yes stop_codon:yes gene_type:complete
MVNDSIFIQFLPYLTAGIAFFCFIVLASYHTAKGKTKHPVIAAVIGGLLGLIPPFALAYLAFLIFRKDLES